VGWAVSTVRTVPLLLHRRRPPRRARSGEIEFEEFRELLSKQEDRV
jgi:hypothetical protein